MRWLIEVMPLGSSEKESIRVEADTWQKALQAARTERGESGSMSGFTIELLDEGCRATDAMSRLMYEVRRSEDDAPRTRPSVRPSPAHHVVFTREQDPTEALPLTYREYVYAVPAGTSETAAETLLHGQLKVVRASIEQAPQGKLVNLAVFDSVSPDLKIPPDRAATPPLATLRWKDWRAESAVVFPRRSGGARPRAASTPEASANGPSMPRPRASSAPEAASTASPVPGMRSRVASVPGLGPPSVPLVSVPPASGTADAAPPVARASTPVPAQPSTPPGPPVQFTPIVPLPSHPVASSPPRATPHAHPEPIASQRPPPSVVVPAPSVAATVLPDVAPSPLAVTTLPTPAPAEPAGTSPLSARPEPQASFPSPEPAVSPATAVTPPHAVPAPTPDPPPQAAAPPASIAPTPVALALPAPPEPVAPSAAEPLPSPSVVPDAAAPPAAVALPPAPQPVAIPPENRSSIEAGPPSSVRVHGEDLIADLFEAMHDLHFLRDALDAGDFCLALAMEKLPSRAGVVHLYDIDRREFLITSTRGSGARKLLLQRHPESEALLSRAMRKRRAVIVAGSTAADAAALKRYADVGGVRSLIVAPVMLAGRFLGAIELLDPLDGEPFTEPEASAVMYIAEQLAQFVAERGVVTDADRIQSHRPTNFA